MKKLFLASSQSSLALSILASGLVCTTSVSAQEAVDQDAAIESNEIVVTAQRRAERLQNVPLSITAATGSDLANHGSSDIRGIAQAVPSLNVTAYPNSSDTVSLTMRGQGSADAGQITKDGGVGMYIDGFYIARPQAALFDLGDPERIEVLRGPQGTLYGRNTTGGAVNIISSKPTGEFGGSVSATYGSRDYVRGLANINLPAIGALSLKGTLLYSNQDGYVKNSGGNNFHGSGQLAGRIAARLKPVDGLTIDYAFARGRVLSTPPYYFNPDLVGLVPGYDLDNDKTYAPLDLPKSRSHFTDHQLTLNYEVNDSLTIRSLSSYRKSDSKQYVNYGVGQSYPFPGGIYTTEQFHDYRAKQYTQELQLVGSIGDRTEYTGGLYYFKETGTHFQNQFLEGAMIPGGEADTSRLIDAKSISKAAYLQVTVTPPILNDRLKATFGARYTEDVRRAGRTQWYYDAVTEDNTRNNQKFDNFSPSINLAMQWNRDVMTYARYSKGYKAGGSAEGGLDFTETFGPEKVEAWEAGVKSQFLDRALTVNLSAFHNKFRDMQIDFAADPIDLSKISTVNAGRATINGLELEVGYRPSRALNLRLSYALLDAKLKQVLAFPDTTFDPSVNPNSPVQVGDDVTGYFAMPFVPDNALTVSGDWEFYAKGGSSVTAYATYSYQSTMAVSSQAGPLVAGNHFYRSDASEVVNLRLAYQRELNNADLTVALFANNVFDNRARQFAIGVGSQQTGFFSQTAPYSEPRVIGAEVKLGF